MSLTGVRHATARLFAATLLPQTVPCASETGCIHAGFSTTLEGGFFFHPGGQRSLSGDLWRKKPPDPHDFGLRLFRVL
jgi:hypothetical protein